MVNYFLSQITYLNLENTCFYVSKFNHELKIIIYSIIYVYKVFCKTLNFLNLQHQGKSTEPKLVLLYAEKQA